MDEMSLVTIVTSVIAALGGTQAWEYYQKRAELKAEQKRETAMSEQDERNLYRDDLRKEVRELRQKVETLNAEKNVEAQQFLTRINDLSQELAAMRVRVEFLERENANLRER